MIKNKPTIIYLFIFLAMAMLLNFVLAQNNNGPNKMIRGKWKVEVMRDSAGAAFDIAGSGDETPSYFYYLTLKKNNKAFLSYGKNDYKAKWEIMNDSITFKLANKERVSHKINSLSKDQLVLEYIIEMKGGRYFKGLIYYKRL